MSKKDQMLLFASIEQVWTHLHRMSGDIRVLGARCGDAEAAALNAKLSTLAADASAIVRECDALRASYLHAVTTGAGVDPSATHLKLHLGSGPYRIESWVNIDTTSTELPIDIRWGLPFAAGSARFVFFSHTLEHLAYPDEARGVLREIHRVLEPGGVLRVIVPDAAKLLAAYASGDEEYFASRKKTWTWWSDNKTRLEGVLTYVGVAPHASPFIDRHQFGYDFETLRKLLLQAGFDPVEQSGYMASRHPELRIDSQSQVAGATYGDEHYSLFVEAMRA